MICTQCRRCNPIDARFCWFDGTVLNGTSGQTGPADIGRLPFVTPFLFPSGRVCRNFEELALACQEEWTAAADMLRRGFLESFLGQIGRADLAQAARTAASCPDMSQGLDSFLARVPSHVLPEPKLCIEPSAIDLGALTIGSDHIFHVRLKNDGKRLLHGSVATLCGWMTIGDGPGAQAKLFQFSHEQTIPVRVNGKLLRAGLQSLTGELVVQSNGGGATVTVTAAVPVKAFPEGGLTGASSPRELAKKIRAAPQAAAALFESGAIARWYQANGWTYPVLVEPATGMAAIQQFFEALGLVQPPKVQLAETAVSLTVKPGGRAQHMLKLDGAGHAFIWAQAASDQPWLELGRTVSAAAGAMVPLVVRSAPNQPGAVLTAQVAITTNGNQHLKVPVRLTISSPAAGLRPSPVAQAIPVSPSGSPAGPPRRARRRSTGYALAVAFLILGYAGAVIHDLLLQPEHASSVAAAPQVESQPRIAVHFHDHDIKVKLGPDGLKPPEGAVDQNKIPATWEPSMRFGLTMVGQPDPNHAGQHKRLTYSEQGLTNNTCIRLDNNEWLFGESPFRLADGQREGNWPGRWLTMKSSLGNNPDIGLQIEGCKSVWIYDRQKVVITQTVAVVPGDQSRLLDTCLVHYLIENRDNRPHRLGLRVLLDTFIGADDGVPFTLPGATQLCDTEMPFNQPREIPDFIEALERPDLRDPGTIAHLGIKRTPPFDPPDRLTLGAWPNFRLNGRDPRCLQEKTLWEVPRLPIKTLTPADSAITIYWNDKDMPASARREMAFTYGLGNVASTEAHGRLGITVGGSFVEDGEFTVTAYVSNPETAETVTLDLPDGFRLRAGTTEQGVPPLPLQASSPNSPVSWLVRGPGKAGHYILKVRASSGVAQSQPITIRRPGDIFN